jgi:hypothetical protein
VWTAVVSVDGEPDRTASGDDRDRVVDIALGWVPDAARAQVAAGLAWRPGLLWLLPARRGTAPGVVVVVRRTDPLVGPS